MIGYSYAKSVPTYEFFDAQAPRHVLINNCSFDHVNAVLSWWRTFARLWRDEPDIVLACGYERPETFAAVIYSKLKRLSPMRRPAIIMMVDNQLHDSVRRGFVERIKKLYLRFSDGFVLGGQTHIDYLATLGVDPSIIRTGYNCVDNDRIATIATSIRASGPLQRFPPHFLTLGRLVPKKNLEVVLQAFASYLGNLPNDDLPWHLVIAGDGPSYAALRALTARLGLESYVHFTGRVDRFDDVVNYYVSCRAFILASNQSEQWGLVVNEAMAASVPVLVSQQCGCSLQVVQEGRNGFTFDGNCVEELTDRMLWLHINDSRLTSMGQDSLAIISEISPQHFARNINDLYRSLEVRIGGVLLIPDQTSAKKHLPPK